MDNFDHEMNLLIQKYLNEVRNEIVTIEQVERRPRWKRVWFWWKALEHYEGKTPPKLTLEECKSIYGDK